MCLRHIRRYTHKHDADYFFAKRLTDRHRDLYKSIDGVIFCHILSLHTFYNFLRYDNFAAVYIICVLVYLKRLVNHQYSAVINIRQLLKLFVDYLICIILQISIRGNLICQYLRL